MRPEFVSCIYHALLVGLESWHSAFTMTDIVKLAQAQLAFHASEAAKLQEFLKTYAALAAMDLPVMDTAVSVPIPAPKAPQKATKARKVKRKAAPSQTQQLYGAVGRVLDRAGAPVRLKDLVIAVAAEGAPVGGKSPASNLSARLGQSGLFASVPDVGWWWKDRPVPPGKNKGALPFESAPGISSEGGSSLGAS